MNTNLNDTTPAAISGRTNVTWQKDGSGNVSASMPTAVSTQTDITASRAIGSTYQNTTGKSMWVSAWGVSGSATPGSFWVVCDSGATPALIVAATGYTANSVNVFLSFIVPSNYYYGVRKDQTMSLSKWIEYS